MRKMYFGINDYFSVVVYGYTVYGELPVCAVCECQEFSFGGMVIQILKTNFVVIISLPSISIHTNLCQLLFDIFFVEYF